MVEHPSTIGDKLRSSCCSLWWLRENRFIFQFDVSTNLHGERPGNWLVDMRLPKFRGPPQRPRIETHTTSDPLSERAGDVIRRGERDLVSVDSKPAVGSINRMGKQESRNRFGVNITGRPLLGSHLRYPENTF